MFFSGFLRWAISAAVLMTFFCFAPAQAKNHIGDEARTLGACQKANLQAGAYYAELQITGLRSAKGRVTIDFYGSNPDDFLAKGKKIIKIHFPAATHMVKGCVKLPGPGRYAIAGYHDENGNHHFDRSWVGMPREGYTFSRDPDALIVPSYEDTAFKTTGQITPVPLKFHYP